MVNPSIERMPAGMLCIRTDQPTNRICDCGASFASGHAARCLKCMVAGVGERPKTKVISKPKAPRPPIRASTGARAKSKVNQKPKIVTRVALLSASSLVKPVAPVRREIVCVLCGETVPKGVLLRHKHDRHGEREITPSPAQDHKGGYLKVFQGGLPSLGKNSR